MKKMDDYGCENLVQAIVGQAVKDLTRLYQHQEYARKNDNIKSIRELERFFLSEYFQVITGCDNGSYIIRQIRKECGYDETGKQKR